MYTVENAIKLMDNTCTTDPQRAAWQTLKAAILAQRKNNNYKECKFCRHLDEPCFSCVNGSNKAPYDRADKIFLFKLVEDLILVGFRGSAQCVVNDVIRDYQSTITKNHSALNI